MPSIKAAISRMLGISPKRSDPSSAAVDSPGAVEAAAAAAPEEPQTAHVGHLQREFERHPARGLTPQRLQAIMVGAEQGDLLGQLDLADDMEERDAHVYAELSKRRGAITGLAWSIEAPDNATADEQSLTDAMKDWTSAIEVSADGVVGGFELLIDGMTDAILKGYAPHEMVWARNQRVMLPRLTKQPQRWFTPSADRRRLLLRSREMTAGTEDLPPVQGEELWPLSWLVHMHPARSGFISRMSLARVLFWPYLFKNYSVRDLAEFLEIYGLPMRVGKYPTGASDDEKRRLMQAVVQLGHNAAGIMPQGMSLEFEAAAAGTEVPFVAMWDRMDAAESKAILGQTLTASEGQHGTQALGSVHNEVRMDIRNSDARRIEATVRRQLFAPIARLNWPGAEGLRMPRLELDTGEAEDLGAFADALPSLAKAGLQIPVKWAQGKLRIPEPVDGEAVMSGPPDPVIPPGADPAADPAGPAGRPGAKPPRKAALAGDPSADPAPAVQDRFDDLVDEAVAEWQPLVAPIVQPLLDELQAAVDRGDTLEAFAARLPELIERMDGRPLAEQLARTSFIGHLAGEAEIDPSHG